MLHGALSVAQLAVSHTQQDVVAVTLLRNIAHMDETRIEDKLVEVYLLAGDDEAERLNKEFATTFTLNPKVRCLSSHVLRAFRRMSQLVVYGIVSRLKEK